jgi:hypothetical protein
MAPFSLHDLTDVNGQGSLGDPDLALYSVGAFASVAITDAFCLYTRPLACIHDMVDQFQAAKTVYACYCKSWAECPLL